MTVELPDTIPFLGEGNRAVDKYAAPSSYIESPDVVVIGSGIGGLALASLVAQLRGWKVLVLEANDVPGGCTHVHERPGWEFPSGIDTVGEMDGSVGRGIIKPTIDFVTNDKLEWAKMPAIHERAYFGDDEYCWHDNLESNLEWILKRFKGSVTREQLETYVALEDKVDASAYGWALTKLMPGGLPKFIREGIFRLKGGTWRKYSARNTWDVFTKEIGFSHELAAVFNFSYGNLGRTPLESPFTLHATAFHHYRWGAYFPVGGPGHIAECIIPVIEAHGGQVAVKSKVDEILCEDNRAVGVKLANGEEIRCPRVVSDVGAYCTFMELLPRELSAKEEVPALFEEIGPSPIHLYVHVGWDEPLDLPQHIVWDLAGHDIAGQVDRYHRGDLGSGTVYLLAPSERDISHKDRYPGKSTAVMLAEAPLDWLERFRAEDGYREEMKQALIERAMAAFNRHMPATVGKEPAFIEAGMPMGCNPWSWNSCSYGLEGSGVRYAKHTHGASTSTAVKGLFLTGQDTFSPGFAGALMGARFAYSAVTRDYKFQLRPDPRG